MIMQGDNELKARRASGLLLPLMEEFYSIQGEGVHTGKAAYFVRLGGCDNSCAWCDVKESWAADKHALVETDLLIDHVLACEAKSVVVTGGEPLLYYLGYFCERLRQHGVKTFLETSGSEPLSGQWDWICLSPKPAATTLPAVCSQADELKVVIAAEPDFLRAESYKGLVGEKCMLLLQPEWSNRDAMMPLIVAYVLRHPEWKISLQTHKYLGIP